MKRSLKFELIIVVILAIIWLASRSGQTVSTELHVPTERAGGNPAQLSAGDKAKPATASSDGRLPLVEMKEAKYEIDYIALARWRENPPFEFRGGSGTGRVVDKNGNVILESNKEFGIFGVSVGPDKLHVLVEG